MSALPLRIFRSFHAKYYEDDILTGPAAYPNEYFDELVANGFNAVWLRGILRDLAPSQVFPALGSEIARHQDALGAVVDRAGRHGVKVLLYLNEPLCLPAEDPFWTEHPEARGAAGQSLMDDWPRTFAFCTSTPQVRSWLGEVSRRLFTDVPGLGGWFLITASEHHTHCYSHRGWKAPPDTSGDCPRCAGRSPAEVVAEVITLLRDGTRAASPQAWTIAWNWSWTMFEEDPQPGILARLPKDVVVLLDWERGGRRTLPTGREILVDEYSLSYVGPSERFRVTRDEALRRGLRVMAKLQIGTTHELATVPNLPLVDHVYRKLSHAETLGLEGILGTWNFGNAFSFNTAVMGRLARTTERPEPGRFVAELAAEYFPGADAEGVAAAVERFSVAMECFPFDVPLMYYGPANYALAYPLTLDPLTGESMGWSWMMHERGDDLSASLRQFSLAEVVDALSAVVRGWREGVGMLEEALAGCEHRRAGQELGVAKIVGCCYRSTRNVYRTYGLRRDRPADAAKQFAEVVADEIANLTEALPILERDPRLGFHAECQGRQFSAEAVRKKLRSLELRG